MQQPVPNRLDASVVMTRYEEPNAVLGEALTGLAAQLDAVFEVVLIEQNPVLGETLEAESFSTEACHIRVVNYPAKGLSDARNRGCAEAGSDLILFLDADAIPDRHWVFQLVAALGAAPDIAIAGGRILPRWLGPPPFLAYSDIVRDQYSILDLGDGTKPVQRVVGTNFGMVRTRAARLAEGGWFDCRLGRRKGLLFGGEEVDLCNRTASQGGRIIYCGDAVVEHQILPERLSNTWIYKRLFYGGYNRVILGGAPNPSKPLSWRDIILLPLILPPYLLGAAWGYLKR